MKEPKDDCFLIKNSRLYIAESFSGRFKNIMEAAHKATGKQVVILVDEYDKPLVENIHNLDNIEHYRSRLSAVYSNFKSSAEHIRLVFLTGVSRFAKLSVFSDLNNLKDISFLNEFADICGITEQEMLASSDGRPRYHPHRRQLLLRNSLHRRLADPKALTSNRYRRLDPDDRPGFLMQLAIDRLTNMNAQDIVDRISKQATQKIGVRSFPIRQKDYTPEIITAISHILSVNLSRFNVGIGH